MTRNFRQTVFLALPLQTLCFSSSLGCDDSDAVQINKEAYEALSRAQEAVDNQDWSEAIKRREEAETRLIMNAEEFVSSGDTRAALVLYEMIMNDNVHALADDRNGVCRSLSKSIPVTKDNVFTQLFWNCPDGILAEWVGGVDVLDQLEPKLVSALAVDHPIHHGDSELIARASFDVDSDGNVSNLVVDSASDEFSAAIRSSLRSATFVPAVFRGEPILRPGMVRTYVWEPAN